MRRPAILRSRKAKSVEPSPNERAAKPETIPGPSTEDATNLLIADVVIRSISRIARDSAKKSLVRKRYNKERADELTSRNTIAKTLLLYGASRIATRSLPGAVFVGGALLAKSALDRRRTRTSVQRKQRIAERLPEEPAATLLKEEK